MLAQTQFSYRRTDFFWTIVICSGTLLVSFFLCGVILLKNEAKDAENSRAEKVALLGATVKSLVQPVVATGDYAGAAALAERLTDRSSPLQRVSLTLPDGSVVAAADGSPLRDTLPTGDHLVASLPVPGGNVAELRIDPRVVRDDTGVTIVLWRTLALCVTTAMLMLAGAGFLEGRIRQPLKSLETLAEAYRSGDLSARWEGKGSAEVHRLAEILHGMASQLSSDQDTIAKHSSHLETANDDLRHEVAARAATEAELTLSVSTERTVGRLAADLLHWDGEAMDTAVVNSLGEICGLTGASGAAVFIQKAGTLKRQWEWAEHGTAMSFPAQVGLQLLPWTDGAAPGKPAVLVVNPAAGPAKIRTTRVPLVEALGAPGAVLVALRDATGHTSGFLMLRRETSGSWMRREIHLAQLTGDIISHAISRADAAAEREKLQDQLLHSQKMEAVGKLSGGIAHDFNNMLVPIIGYSDSILSAAAPGAPWLEELQEIKRAAESAASLTRQLLTFSRKQITSRRELEMNRLIHDLQKMLHRLLGENVQVETELDPHLWTVMADAGQMEQCLVNLAVNARHAMPGGGRITISTATIDHEAADFTPPPGKKVQGVFVRLSVTDNGCGMDESTMRRIFEPFFTTKGHDGTGLGLSVVHGVMEEHGGWVSVQSRLGGGSSFELYLPALHEPAEEVAVTAPVESLPAPAPARGAGQRILLIEDEAGVMLFVAAALRKHGYEVFTAEDGSTARAAFLAHGASLDLVISDVVLPDCSGVDLLEEFIPGNPQMRFMLSSGYSERESLVEFVQRHGIVFLHKPYALTGLLSAVKQALTGDGETLVA